MPFRMSHWHFITSSSHAILTKHRQLKKLSRIHSADSQAAPLSECPFSIPLGPRQVTRCSDGFIDSFLAPVPAGACLCLNTSCPHISVITPSFPPCPGSECCLPLNTTVPKATSSLAVRKPRPPCAQLTASEWASKSTVAHGLSPCQSALRVQRRLREQLQEALTLGEQCRGGFPLCPSSATALPLHTLPLPAPHPCSALLQL